MFYTNIQSNNSMLAQLCFCGLCGWSVELHGDAVLEVEDSNIGPDTIVGGVFHPVRHLARFLPLNMPFIANSKFV